jgi:hypothetical protein
MSAGGRDEDLVHKIRIQTLEDEVRQLKGQMKALIDSVAELQCATASIRRYAGIPTYGLGGPH